MPTTSDLGWYVNSDFTAENLGTLTRGSLCITTHFIDFHFENVLSLVMFLYFRVETELVPTAAKSSFYLIENPIN